MFLKNKIILDTLLFFLGLSTHINIDGFVEAFAVNT